MIKSKLGEIGELLANEILPANDFLAESNVSNDNNSIRANWFMK